MRKVANFRNSALFSCYYVIIMLCYVIIMLCCVMFYLWLVYGCIVLLGYRCKIILNIGLLKKESFLYFQSQHKEKIMKRSDTGSRTRVCPVKADRDSRYTISDNCCVLLRYVSSEGSVMLSRDLTSIEKVYLL